MLQTDKQTLQTDRCTLLGPYQQLIVWIKRYKQTNRQTQPLQGAPTDLHD